MLKEESGCVDCGLPCRYQACPHYRITYHVCDDCGEPAEYQLNGGDYCRECVEKHIDEMMAKELSLEMKVEMLELTAAEFCRIGG